MIYLVGSMDRARRWMLDNPDVDRRDVVFVTSLEKAHSKRPLIGDRIVALYGSLAPGIVASAVSYLNAAQELAKTRRDISLRQAP